MPSPRSSPADSLQVLRGAPAERALHDPDFRQSWDELADACPWTTVFQRAPFARTWFGVYGERHEAVLVVQRDTAGRLMGLLVLAWDRSDGSLAHVGRHHAEYQVWLARPSHQATFPAAAFRAVQQACPDVTRMSLLYLPADVQPDWMAPLRRAGLTADVRAHARGIMQVGAGSTIEASLRKSANKSRLARLRREGEVTFAQLTTRDALEPLMDTIVVHCDHRHGAVHGIAPFAADPLKRAYYLALMETPGLAHATVLRAGDALIAAHLSVADPRAVPLGLTTYSPDHADASPGKLLMLLLGRLLGEQGYTRFDLTPGDDAYKARFATTTDQVQSIEVWFSRRARMLTRSRRLGVRVVFGSARRVAHVLARGLHVLQRGVPRWLTRRTA